MVFRVEHDGTGWRVVDGCLNFGPYEGRAEAAELARALNDYDWSKGGDVPLESVCVSLLDEIAARKPMN